MVRTLQALIATLMVAVFAAACSPSAKINEEDPFSTLHPWNAYWSQVKQTESGLQYIVVKKGEGKGPHPSPADRIQILYDGRFADSGQQFDSSGDEPVTFRLNTLIPGWVEGLQLMQPGDSYMFWIPSDLAYGERGFQRGGVPGGADLMFHISLLDVIPAVSPDPDAWAKVTPWPTDSPDVIRTSSGLEYLAIDRTEPKPRDDETVNLDPPTERDFAIVHYEGRLDDGSVVASTFEEQNTETFPLAQLVPGWSEALMAMRPGDHWMVRIPPHLMYGAEGDGRIPPNATVVYEVRLEDVVRIDPPPADPVSPAPPR